MRFNMTITSLCSFIAGVCFTLLVLRFGFNIYTIEPYWIICALLIALTIGTTAFVAAKDYSKEIEKKV